MTPLVRKMGSLKLLKVELIGGSIFSAIALIGLPIGLFCVAPALLTEPLALAIILCGMLFFGMVGYFLFVPHAKDMESELFRFFDGVMNNT